MIEARRFRSGGDASKPDAHMFAGLLQSFYSDLLQQGVPERMASLVRQLSDASVPRQPDRRSIAIVVESDESLRGLAAALLEETELMVLECSSAEGALSVLQRHGARVAFIFADEELAGPRDGADLARSAATLWPHVQVVLTADRPERLSELPDGVRAMRKPWRGLDVLIAAEQALARSKRHA